MKTIEKNEEITDTIINEEKKESSEPKSKIKKEENIKPILKSEIEKEKKFKKNEKENEDENSILKAQKKKDFKGWNFIFDSK